MSKYKFFGHYDALRFRKGIVLDKRIGYAFERNGTESVILMPFESFYEGLGKKRKSLMLQPSEIKIFEYSDVRYEVPVERYFGCQRKITLPPEIRGHVQHFGKRLSVLGHLNTLEIWDYDELSELVDKIKVTDDFLRKVTANLSELHKQRRDVP